MRPDFEECFELLKDDPQYNEILDVITLQALARKSTQMLYANALEKQSHMFKVMSAMKINVLRIAKENIPPHDRLEKIQTYLNGLEWYGLDNVSPTEDPKV